MSHSRWFLTLVCLLPFGTGSAQAPDLDVVIRGGRVIDPETRHDRIANVGIRNGVIEVVTDAPLTASRVIDARGRVVAPGFVDGTTVGHGALRFAVGATKLDQPATAEELDRMLALARRGIREGAIGIGFGVQYIPGTSEHEVLSLLQVAADEGVPVHLHTRSSADAHPRTASRAYRKSSPTPPPPARPGRSSTSTRSRSPRRTSGHRSLSSPAREPGASTWRPMRIPGRRAPPPSNRPCSTPDGRSGWA